MKERKTKAWEKCHQKRGDTYNKPQSQSRDQIMRGETKVSPKPIRTAETVAKCTTTCDRLQQSERQY